MTERNLNSGLSGIRGKRPKYPYVCPIILILIILSLFVAPVSAQDTDTTVETKETAGADGLSLDAAIGFGGRIRTGCYFPVRVTVENSGNDRRGMIRILSEDYNHPLPAISAAECDIPANSRKTYTLYPYFTGDDPSPAIYIQYVEGSDVIVSLIETLDFVRENEGLWVEVADEGYDLTFINQLGIPKHDTFEEIGIYAVNQMQGAGGARGYYGANPEDEITIDYDTRSPILTGVHASDLPDRVEGYQGVEGIILNSRRFYELTEMQHVALGEWVLSGGSMIFWLGDDPGRYQGSFLTRAVDNSGKTGPSVIYSQPVRTTLTQLSTLPGFLGGRAVLGNFPVTYASQSNATTLLSEGSTPILQHIPFGEGNIILSGLDLASLKGSTLTGLEKYFTYILGYLNSVDSRLSTEYSIDTTNIYRSWQGAGNPFTPDTLYYVLYMWNNVLQSDNLTALPGLGGIALFLASYVVLIGPVNYIVLLKLRRREWLWYTIPLLVAIFCLFSYWWALGTKGNKLMLTRLNVEDAYPEQGILWQNSAFGLFSPASRSYDIHLDGDSDLLRVLHVPSVNLYTPWGGPAPVDEVETAHRPTLIQDGRNGESYISDSYIRIWSEEHFESSGSLPFNGTAQLQNVSLVNKSITGTLNYDLDFDLEMPTLIYPVNNGFIITSQRNGLGFTAGGRTGSGDFTMNTDLWTATIPDLSAYYTGIESVNIELRAACLALLSSRNKPGHSGEEMILAGWRSGDPVRALTNPGIRERREETLVLIHIPFTFAERRDWASGAETSIVYYNTQELEIKSPSSLELTDGSVMVAVTFPSSEDVNPAQMDLEIRVHLGTSPQDNHVQPEISCFNHVDGQWEQVTSRLTGLEPHQTTMVLGNIRPLSRYLTPDNRSMYIMISGDPDAVDEIISVSGISLYEI